jgi:hypothetical protein
MSTTAAPRGRSPRRCATVWRAHGCQRDTRPRAGGT